MIITCLSPAMATENLNASNLLKCDKLCKLRGLEFNATSVTFWNAFFRLYFMDASLIRDDHECLEFLDLMRVAPNVHTVQIVVDGLLKNKRIQEPHLAIERAVDKMTHDMDTLEDMLAVWKHKGNTLLAVQVWSIKCKYSPQFAPSRNVLATYLQIIANDQRVRSWFYFESGMKRYESLYGMDTTFFENYSLAFRRHGKWSEVPRFMRFVLCSNQKEALLSYLVGSKSLSNYLEIYANSMGDTNWSLLTGLLSLYRDSFGSDIRFFSLYRAAFVQHAKVYLVPAFLKLHHETLIDTKQLDVFCVAQELMRMGIMAKQVYAEDYDEDASEYVEWIHRMSKRIRPGGDMHAQQVYVGKQQLGLQILLDAYINIGAFAYNEIFPMHHRHADFSAWFVFDFSLFDGVNDRLQIVWIIANRLMTRVSRIRSSTVLFKCPCLVQQMLSLQLLSNTTHGMQYVEQEGLFYVSCDGQDLYCDGGPPFVPRIRCPSHLAALIVFT